MSEHSRVLGVVKDPRTEPWRRTCARRASRDGRTVFVSIFGSEDLYAETAQLLDWAFTLSSGCNPPVE